MTVKEANNVVSNVEDSLYNVGVEIFKDGDFLGSCLASDVFPCDDNIVIEVYLTKNEPGSPYEYKCIEDDTIFACNIMEVIDDNDIEDDAKVLVRIVDYDSREIMNENEPCYAWENTEREEITFTVKINM